LPFAKALGARVIVTCGSDDQLQRALDPGADFGINYRQAPEWGLKARSLTGGCGVDCVVEIGGEGTLPQSVAALRRGGHIGIVGYLAGLRVKLTLIDLIERHAKLHGGSVGNREDFVEMTNFL
jgi:NADPH:quinone reductase-like Zn-dependent oxidoreductase